MRLLGEGALEPSHRVLNLHRSLSALLCSRWVISDSLWPRWTAALQAPLFFTVSQGLFRFMSVELGLLSNHLILCHPPSLSAFSLSQHEGLFHWVVYYQVAKVLDCKESWVLKNWCFWTVVLETTLESPLDCKEIKPINPKGYQSWIFIGRTDAKAEAPILWPPDVKSWLIGKVPDAGKDWRQEEKGMTKDEVVGWYHWFNGHEFE